MRVLNGARNATVAGRSQRKSQRMVAAIWCAKVCFLSFLSVKYLFNLLTTGIGNSLEYCGGSGGINIYQAANAASGPSVLQSYNGWSTEGCYVDSVADRSMPYAVNTVDAASMTVEKCLDACSGLGYTYAGLEYAQECYCGSALPAEEATDGRCSMVCNGEYPYIC